MADPIVSEIHIEATPQTVFEFFVDPNKLTRWLAIEANLEPHAGGRCEQVHDTGEAWGKVRMLGTFVAVEPPKRVVFTWGFAEPEIGVPPGSSTVEVTLTPAGSGTHVRLEHHDLPAAEIEAHTAGWAGMLVRLSEAVSEA
jgi:uncharacterized protein YndB with AHSA1/START domain